MRVSLCVQNSARDILLISAEVQRKIIDSDMKKWDGRNREQLGGGL